MPPLAHALIVALVLGLPAGGSRSRLEPLAPLSVPRAVHTATSLADGGILVVGGCSTPGCELGSRDAMVAERWDPATRRFAPAGSLREWRDDHTATRLQDGRVLVAGGWGANGVLASTELYEPRSRLFVPGPSMAARRAGATATLLQDGRVLLAGGFVGNRPTSANAEVFVPGPDAVRPVGRLSVPRGAHAAALLRDGRVLVVGGLSRGRVVPSTEIFDPRRGRFSPGPALRVPRYKAAAVTLRDGRVLVVGGAADIEGSRVYRTTELYDPRRDRFSAGPLLVQARYKLAGSVVRVGRSAVLVAGGGTGPEVLDVATGHCHLVGSYGRRLLFTTATASPRGVLLAGGYDERIAPTAAAWLFR